MPDTSPHIDDLTDAIARGRLALAEVAAIPPRELDAMFELAAQCLDAGRNAEAVFVLGGLVALFPFSGRFWRAYAIALHRQLDLDRARAAYEAALALEPGHELALCYRAEVLIYLGESDLARRELEALREARDRQVRTRARELLQRLPELAAFRPRAPLENLPEPTSPGADLPRFTIGGTRELPLIETQFMDGDDTMQLMKPEVTSTARIFAEILDEPTQPLGAPTEPTTPTITKTAIIRHRKHAAPPAKPADLDITDTGLVGARAKAQAQARAQPAKEPPKPEVTAAVPQVPAEPEATLPHVRREPTHTAVALRRAQLPLVGEGAGEAPPESTAIDGEAPPDDEDGGAP